MIFIDIFLFKINEIILLIIVYHNSEDLEEEEEIMIQLKIIL